MTPEPIDYNKWHDAEEPSVMHKMKVPLKQSGGNFGKRLASLRHAAGYSLRELDKETGISYRMIAYYEKGAGHIPIELLPILAKTLNVSSDQLLGIEKVKANGRTLDNRLWRRFSQMEKLPPTRRKPIIQVIDSFLEGEKLKQKG